MSRYTIILVMFCVFSSIGNAIGQDKVRTVLENIQQSFDGMRQLHMIMKTDYYTDSLDQKPFKSDQTELWMAGDQSKVITANVELLSGPHYLIITNHELQLVQYQEKDLANGTSGSNLTKMFNLDSLLSAGPDIHVINENDDQIHLGWRSPRTLVQQFDVFIKKENSVVEKMKFSYNSDQLGNPLVVVITYPVFDMNSGIANDVFGEYKYFLMKENKPVLAKRLSGYTVQETKNIELN